MTTGNMWDDEARLAVSELRAEVERDGQVTRAAIEALHSYLREREAEQKRALGALRQHVEDIDATAAQLSSAARRTEQAIHRLERRDADLATIVARTATTGGATGGGVVAAIVSIALGLLHGCGP